MRLGKRPSKRKLPQPFLAACTLPLGLQNGRIKNSSITASTYIEGAEPHNARLNSIGYDGWCAESNDQAEFIMFDLKTVSPFPVL